MYLYYLHTHFATTYHLRSHQSSSPGEITLKVSGMCPSRCLHTKQGLLPIFRNLNITFLFLVQSPHTPFSTFLSLLFSGFLPLFHQVSYTLIFLLFHGSIYLSNTNAHIFKRPPCWNKIGNKSANGCLWENIHTTEHLSNKTFMFRLPKDP